MTVSTEKYVKVHLLDVLPHLDIPYTYYVPFPFSGDIVPGDFAVVPFGNANRKKMALICAVSSKCDIAQPKPVVQILPRSLRLNDEMLGLCSFMKEHTFCTVGDAARAILPTGAIGQLRDRYEINPEKAVLFAETQETDSPAEKLISFLVQHGNGAGEELLRSYLGEEPGKNALVRKLMRESFLSRRTDFAENKNQKEQVLYFLAIPPQEAHQLIEGNATVKKKYGIRSNNAIYQKLLTILLDGAAHEALALIGESGAATANLHYLESKGVFGVRREWVDRNPYEKYMGGALPPEMKLSEEQQSAFEALKALADTGQARAALLFGITGSGKTMVMKAMMDHIIEQGRQVILLVPEIALTPQSVGIFCSYYKERVAVVHSALSAGERLDVWKKVREGKVDLVIGTRSAVFVPFDHLGMIIIDEEQEHTYKSDTSPKYHARDIARYRCAKNQALMLLASATPSLESYYKTQTGSYSLVKLTGRYGDAHLPEVVMADLRKDDEVLGYGALGSVLRKDLEENLVAGEQSILFINRRGYHNYMSCMSCGEPVMCPRCSVSLTCHLSPSDMKNREKPRRALLLCHYCGYKAAAPETCPSCGSEHLKYFGFGTQLGEEELNHDYPDAKILRMDADTTTTKFSHEKILTAFRNHEADILLGTQMVTKGHDFPEVTLVGVLNADGMLYQDDYRATEKTFSLLTQVIGRAGRAGKGGRAVIQTYNPENETLQLAAKQDYEAFYHGAIALRKALVYPPFCDMVLISFSGTEEKEVMRVSAMVQNRIATQTMPNGDYHDVPLQLFGPFEAGIYKLNDRFRMRLVMKCRMNRRSRQLFSTVLNEIGREIGVRVSIGIDVNPTNL